MSAFPSARSRLLALLALLPLGGCLCLDIMEAVTTPPPGPFSVVGEYDPALAACAADKDAPSPEDLTRALSSAQATGDLDLAVTDGGCYRYRRQGGMASLLHIKGQDGLLDGGVLEYRTSSAVLFQERTEGASQVVEIDANGDGVVDLKTTESPLGAGFRRVVETFDGSGTPQVRRTLDLSNGTLAQTEERFRAGAWSTLAQFSTTSLQRACAIDTNPATPEVTTAAAPCTPAQDTALRAQLAQAMASGWLCFAGSPITFAMQLWTLQRMFSRPVEFSCFESNKAYYAATDTGVTDKLVMQVNTNMFFSADCGVPVNQLQGTLFHEASHHLFGGHDKDLEGNVPDDAWPYVDQVTACERMCFSARPSSCHCAACKQVRVCDRGCDSDQFAPCEQELTDAGTQVRPGQQVGASCSADKSWFNTYAECAAAGGCSGGGGGCKKRTLSCTPGCE